MTSWWRHLLLKKDLEPSAILDPPFWIFEMYSILLKTRRNRGNHDGKNDLCKTIPMKQKNLQVVKLREKLRLLKNWTPHLPLGHFKLMFFFFRNQYSCHTSMNIWYSVIIHERSNDFPSLRMRSSRQHR